MSQSRNSDASFLTANPGGVAIADAWAYGAASSTASAPAGPSNMRLEICSVPTHVRMNALHWSLTRKLCELSEEELYKKDDVGFDVTDAD